MRQNGEQVLIDTMKRLILTIHNNKIQQFKTFESLSKTDFIKVLQNFDSKEIIIRKMSARLISQLLYDNNTLKDKFAELLEIYPSNGNIMFNKIPDHLKQQPQRVLEIMQTLKKSEPKERVKTLCWYIDMLQQDISVKYLQLSSFSLNDFFDPQDVIFGMYYGGNGSQNKQKQKQKSISMLKQTDYSTNTSKYQYKATTPSTTEKPRFQFSSRQRGVSEFQKGSQVNSFNSIQISYKNNKNIQEKSRFSNPITDRHLKTATNQLSSSTYNRSKEPEIVRGKIKSGIEITSPSNITSSHKLKSEKSGEKSIILLGGKSVSKELSNSINFTPSSQIKSYMFNTSKSPTLTNYVNSNSTTPSPKLQYTRLTSLRAKQRQQPQTKSFNTYKPSDDFIRKIKESIRTRQ